jgi:hypothetical protein
MSELRLREWRGSDYDMVRGWWERWGRPPSRSAMGDLGVLALEGDRPLAAIFLFPAEAGYCLITGAISDFDRPVGIREEAVCRVTAAAFIRARELGYHNVRMYVATRGYVRALERRGLARNGPKRNSIFISPVYLPFLGEDDA